MIKDTTLRYITLNLLILGGLLWSSMGAFGINPVSRLAKQIGLSKLSRVIYVMIGIATIVFLFKFYKRDTFLPFLGQSMMPPSLIKLSHPLDYNESIKLKAPSGASHIVYWASQGKGEISEGQNFKEAYGDFMNSGAIAVSNGEVEIKFKKPVSYTVKGSKTLEPHVHYRWVHDDGLMSSVETIDL